MKKHILLIEKTHEGFIEFMKVLDESLINCKVTYARNHDHALKMLQYIVPDCIFMRVDTCPENTLECVRKIRRHSLLENTRLIVYDDEVNSDMIRRSISMGADYCIDRPDSCANLNYLLKDVFDMT
jgi:DNA-binding NarL/FixJ family response regulator